METTSAILHIKMLNALNNVPAASFASVSYGSECKLTKKDKAEIGADVVSVSKITKLEGVQLAFSYKNAVNRHIEKVSGEKGEYEAQAPKGKVWKNYPLTLTNTDGTKDYVRVYKTKKTKSVGTLYLVNGEVATAEQTAKIKELLAAKPVYGCQKQAESGLEIADQVKPLDITMSNIIELNGMGKKFLGDTKREIAL